MSDKDKDKNVVEQLLDSVITSSDSNIGPIEQRLNEIAKSPNWELNEIFCLLIMLNKQNKQ